MNPAQFVKSLRALNFVNTFNPYIDRCALHDHIDAPTQRAAILGALLDVATGVEIDSIWIGRDLGYRGGRRTGLALTDDKHLQAHAARWGLDVKRPTKGEIVSERTATVIWDILFQLPNPVFLWNVFPLHPHEPEDPFSNRSHNVRERKAGEEVLSELIALLKPRRLVAIGNDANKTAERLGGTADVIRVRHPSYGGQTEFVAQMCELYSLHPTAAQRSFFEISAGCSPDAVRPMVPRPSPGQASG